ncbi:MAG: hypothetical protein J3R72DRAFT_175622 [Linnemannia gamsii]|nr:MAG: hypothetical protein J3R72DRAFT_175622 [Linnemannia gamsii]
MVAVAMNKLIVTYSMVNSTTAYFNTFDTATNTWAGLGLVGTPVSGGDGSSKSTPIGAIVGGAVGGIVVIALIAFLFIRSRRNKSKAASKDIDGHANTNKTGESNGQDSPHVYTYVPETVPVPIVQQPVFFDPQAATIVATPTYYDPNHAAAAPVAINDPNTVPAVYDPNANIYNQNFHVYDSGFNSYEAPGAGAYPPPPPSSTVYTSVPPVSQPSPYQNPAMSPYSSTSTKTGSPAGPQFVDPESYSSPKNIGSPQYVEAREPLKNSSDPEYYRP